MGRTIVQLPAEVGEHFDVYVNGVPQRPDIDFTREQNTIVFDRLLRKDRISGWRWFLGAWGIGTYRPDDTVDIRYQAHGSTHVAHNLPITIEHDANTHDT